MAEPIDRFALKLENLRKIRRIAEKDKELIREIWMNVEKDYALYGRSVFKDLFTLFPTYKRFFMEILSGDEDPFESPLFQKHMLQVLLPTIGGVISQLDSPEAVYEALKRLGVLHKTKEIGLRRENVDTLIQCLLSTLKRLNVICTEEEEEALTRFFGMLVNMFSNGLEGKSG